MSDLSLPSWRAFLAVPRAEQRAALEQWLAALPDEQVREAWNAAFGPGSLFDAWTRSSVVQALHGANAATLAQHLAPRGKRSQGWRAVEIGGGDGRLWEQVGDVGPGTLIVIDPVAQAGERVAERAPPGVRVQSIQARVEHTLDHAFWHDLDAVVCSLTLHHLAGADAAERAAHGLSGPGKLEVLLQVRDALAPDGLALINEADIHCDVQIPPGDLLAERLLDSYVRRCAGSLLEDIATRADADDDLRARWASITRHWCLEQVRYADVPLPERDVYELDVTRWLALFDRAGLVVRQHHFTDRVLLFHRYVLARP